MALHAMRGQMIKDGFGPPDGEDDKTESWKPAPKKGAKSARKANAVALAAQAVADGGSDSDSDEDGDGNAGAGAAVGAAAATNNAVAKVDWAALDDESIVGNMGAAQKKQSVLLSVGKGVTDLNWLLNSGMLAVLNVHCECVDKFQITLQPVQHMASTGLNKLSN